MKKPFGRGVGSAECSSWKGLQSLIRLPCLSSVDIRQAHKPTSFLPLSLAVSGACYLAFPSCSGAFLKTDFATPSYRVLVVAVPGHQGLDCAAVTRGLASTALSVWRPGSFGHRCASNVVGLPEGPINQI